MKVYRISESETKGRAGYTASYVADIVFSSPASSTGVIVVKVPRNTKTEPHAHAILEEIFVVMNRTRMGVGDTILDLDPGDVVVADPGEAHWFETYHDDDLTLIALKVPNLKDDKVSPETR